jgi:hypothetical protein
MRWSLAAVFKLSKTTAWPFYQKPKGRANNCICTNALRWIVETDSLAAKPDTKHAPGLERM